MHIAPETGTVLSTTNSSVTYTSDGVTTAYPTTFQLYDTSHLVVTYGPTTGLENSLSLGVGFTVTGPTGTLPNTATVNLTSPVTSTYKIVIKRVVPLTQLVDLLQSGPFQADVVERIADLFMMAAQQLNDGGISVNSFVHGNYPSAADGTYHGDAVYNGNSGFLSGALRKTYDDHVASTSNPHSVTAAQAGAAPSSHVMSTDTASTGHPLATASTPGFMSAAQFSLLATVSVNDPRSYFKDNFDGSDLNTDVWTKHEAAGAGTYLSLTGDSNEQGQLEITTPAVGSNTCGIYTKARGPFTTRNPIYYARVAQPVHAGSTARWGICNDYSGGAPTHFALFYWDGGNLNCQCQGGGAATNVVIATPSDGTFYEYEIIVGGAGTTFDFFVNGAGVAHITTNLPSTSKGLGPFFEINPTGAAAKKLQIDYVLLTFTRAYT